MHVTSRSFGVIDISVRSTPNFWICPPASPGSTPMLDLLSVDLSSALHGQSQAQTATVAVLNPLLASYDAVG